ncbi:hypothetical protein Nazgul10 [Burkholderia phage BcepNazgul]|uniref:Uncharacterized protein n=1 Tax=Burkholderia phage BcepNazgul TaxID=242861 RepID=Q6UYF5_9CAUD|nr:hypothetical protein Nazgul10 [Burkholderia phage BcepNazgul]AAQ63386.2 hypothetical protein Nazgul10 [Burkholderia phage BcepNazgul]
MNRLSPLTPEFTFAGFNFPRYIARMPKRFASIAERNAYPCGEYYHAPKPNSTGKGFYLESDGAPGLRWQWCDEVEGACINHTGWFADEHGDGDTIRGVVFRLPHGRGFLAGWSKGECTASEITYDCIYINEIFAAQAAATMARLVAERCRDTPNEPEPFN